ncbi:MAG: sbcc family protein [Syntrophorhabdaceae bacterium]
MRPISLTLKGFKGIKSGMNREEITIDFTSLPKGLIVFDAATGTGKTTILDNMSPYRILPYHVADKTYSPDAFYAHTYGEWLREYIFELDDVRYRSLINGDTDRRKQEAFLYHWGHGNPGKWIPEPGIDGKLGPYDQAVERILGTPSLYYTSIHRAQNAKALSDYTKGSIKELFIELLNIENLQAIGEKARRIKQDLAGKVELLMIERRRLQDILTKEPETRTNITNVQRDIEYVATEIMTDEQEIISLQERINECDVKINLQRIAQAQIDQILDELHAKEKKYKALSETAETKGLDLAKKSAALQNSIKTAEDLTGRLPYLRGLAQKKTEKETYLQELKADISNADTALAVMNQNLNDILALDNQIKDKENSLGTMVQKRQSELKASQRQLEEANKQAEYIKNSNCPIDNPTCNLMKAAVEQRDQIENIECDIAFHGEPKKAEIDLQAEILVLKAKRTDPEVIRGQIKAVTQTKADLVETEKLVQEEIQTMTQSLERLPFAEQAEKRLPELKTELTTIDAETASYGEEVNKELVALKADIDELTLKVVDATDPADHTKTKQDLIDEQTDRRKQIDGARIREAGHRKHLGALEESLKQIAQATDELDTIGARITHLNDEISQWATLEKAFGKEGILALEIDDCGPQVSAYCNELLKIYDAGYSVKIITQEEKANNGGNKEVFDISVFDPVLNEWKSIKLTSGGQRALYEDSVTKAISVYNKNASDRNIKSTFTDEKDSALDIELRKYYFEVKRKVLELGGFDQEFCITHTEELKTMADAVIRLSKENGVEIITQ